MNLVVALGYVPPVELFPESWHGEPMVVLLAVYAGDAEEGERVLRPLRDLGGAIADLSAWMPYTVTQSVLEEATQTAGDITGSRRT